MRSWRQRLLRTLGPGTCAGITFGDWLELLRANRFAIDPPYWPRAAVISACSLLNSVLARYETATYGPKVRDVHVKPPLFILGFWRSGTTHLHNLLAVDRRFAYPNLYQVYFPHTFLATEALLSAVGGLLLPDSRPQDNVRHGFETPAEDERATCVATSYSPHSSAIFPRHEASYDKYITFRDASAEDIARWKEALVLFLKKLTWKYDRPLILKSPAHTCRIRLLLDLFPGARFVHIRRNPYAVFQSNKRGRSAVRPYMQLQRDCSEQFDPGMIQRYKKVYEVFFEECRLVPRGQFHEVSFEDLEREPLGQIREIYETLDLPAFEEVEAPLRRYIGSLATYTKNEHPPLPPAIRDEIARGWRRNFDEWGYAV